MPKHANLKALLVDFANTLQSKGIANDRAQAEVVAYMTDTTVTVDNVIAIDEFGTQWYIVCNQCGEPFDTILTASGHAGTCGSDQGFDILPDGAF